MTADAPPAATIAFALTTQHLLDATEGVLIVLQPSRSPIYETLSQGEGLGSGVTRLSGACSIGDGFAVDGGRTNENDGGLNRLSGSIALGSGDAGAVTRAGTLTNVAGTTLFVTAWGGRIAVPGVICLSSKLHKIRGSPGLKPQ